MPLNLHIFSFFSGSGFLDLGFERAGYTIDLVNEFSPSFSAAYQYARHQMGMPAPQFGYTRDVNEYLQGRGNELREQIREIRQERDTLVGFIGGPPCPDFSVAGKQKGRNGDNGKLSLSYVTLIRRMLPDFFLFENVKGLWQTARHRAYYEELKQSLDRNYFLADRLTNALEFGAPQDRDRILLFGVKKCVARRLHLNIANFDFERHSLFNLEEVKNLPWPGQTPFAPNVATPCPAGIPEELTAQYWFEHNDVEHHPNGQDFFTPRAGLARMQTVQEGDDSKKCYKRIHRWRYSPTACYGNNEVHLHPYKERRLSVAETLAIQSLPPEFCLPPNMTLSDKFKTVGNGVPYLLANGVARAISDFLNNQ